MSNLGPYELRGELGRGAMAIVWRAYDPSLDREVAIKEPLFPDGLDEATQEELAARFVREARSVAKLSHPGIITVHSADVFDGRPAIVMELIEGSTLGELLSRGPMNPELTVSILDQLLEAVAFAHEKGIVHRDIKPDNIFVSPDGRVKLADFGIAHNAEAATALTQAGTIMGTPGYMAPEQIRGEVVDARADLFSVGAIAYECMSGRNPFGITEGESMTTIMYKVTHEDPAPLDPEAFPDWIIGITSGLLQRDSSVRYQTAAQAQNDLRGQVMSVRVKPPQPKSKTALYSIIGAVVAVVTLGAILLSGQGGGEPGLIYGSDSEPPSVTTELTSPASPEERTNSWAIAHMYSNAVWAISPEGENKTLLSKDGYVDSYSAEGMVSELVWSENEELLYLLGQSEGWDDIWAIDSSGQAEMVWSDGGMDSDWGIDFSLRALAINPDGELRALQGAGAVNSLDLIKQTPGKIDFTLEDGLEPSYDGFFWDMQWSPDGKSLLYLDDTGHGIRDQSKMKAYPLISGPKGEINTEEIYGNLPESFGGYIEPSWSPDSTRFIAINYPNQDSIDAFDSLGQFVRQLFSLPAEGTIGSLAWSPGGDMIAFSVDNSIWVMSADGTDAQEIGVGREVAWVPINLLE